MDKKYHKILICKELKTSLENTRESMNSKTNLNSELKVSGYIINTQKSIVFIDTNDNQLENILVKKSPFTIATTMIKYLQRSLKKRGNPIRRNIPERHRIRFEWKKRHPRSCIRKLYIIKILI